MNLYLACAWHGIMMNRKRIWVSYILWLLCVVIVLGIAAAALVYAVYDGRILLNNPSQKRYPIRGVDVSHYQGEIDWQVLSGEDIAFAYIKATEGSSHTDEKFLKNWEDARQTDLKVGAYHFFSFDSPGESQLEHFIEVIPAFEEMLPPAVDFEFYADKKINPPEAEPVRQELRIMLRGLEEYYGVTPVLYATEESWEMYLEGYFDDYPLWIRNVIKKPDIGGRKWQFWQYTNRGRLAGYHGEEEFIDINVFAGNEEEWERWRTKE